MNVIRVLSAACREEDAGSGAMEIAAAVTLVAMGAVLRDEKERIDDFSSITRNDAPQYLTGLYEDILKIGMKWPERFHPNDLRQVLDNRLAAATGAMTSEILVFFSKFISLTPCFLYGLAYVPARSIHIFRLAG